MSLVGRRSASIQQARVDGRRALLLALACASIAALARPARATDGSFICGRKVVMLGDSAADVLSRCGPPTQRQGGGARGRSGRSRASGAAARSPLVTAGRAGRGRRGEEIWIYEFGSRQLVRVLYFAAGRLTRIEVGGYGG
jgi:uncharacterized protein DUF2845